MLDDALFLASKAFWMVVRPNTLALLLLSLGVLLLLARRRFGRWPALLGLAWFIAVATTPLATWLTWPLENRFARPDPAPTRVDGVVVLGGAVDQELTAARGIPALNGAAERMTEAVALARRFPQARIIFTGGTPNPLGNALTEADVARQVFTALGLPPERVVYENQARNTHENATLSRPLANPQPGQVWLLVTSASHMPRAMGVFRAAGWPITAWPVNYSTGTTHASGYDAPFSQRLGMAEWALREYTGLAAYWALGRTNALLPAP
ncbi:MAG: YdcF family protein [Alphaproteobacteria bacterium]|nr:YdcF family protein [Alphaproteobacteria bacterium]